MKINRKELLEVLSLIKPGLSNNEMVEQSTHFIFEAGEVYTYNDQIKKFETWAGSRTLRRSAWNEFKIIDNDKDCRLFFSFSTYRNPSSASY